MAPLNLFTVVGASLLFLNKTGSAVGTEPTYTVTLGGDGKCLSDINAARQAAGLTDLAQAKTVGTDKMPDGGSPATTDAAKYKAWVWYPVCETLLTKNTPTVAAPSTAEGGKFPNGTYAYYPADSDSVDCKTVLKQWKDAYKNFDGLPPKYSKDAQVYKNTDNVSLVSMYNPSNKATADCRMVTCTKKPTDAAAVSGYALMCLTVPDALNKTSAQSPPFTQEQWDKIVSAIKGSASAASPSLVGIVAAVLGFVMMML